MHSKYRSKQSKKALQTQISDEGLSVPCDQERKHTSMKHISYLEKYLWNLLMQIYSCNIMRNTIFSQTSDYTEVQSCKDKYATYNWLANPNT